MKLTDFRVLTFDCYGTLIDWESGIHTALQPLLRKAGLTLSRDAVLETAVQRLDLSQKQAAEAYTLAEKYETNPRSVWGYVQGLTRLSQRTPWQDGRFTLDRAAGRLLTTVH